MKCFVWPSEFNAKKWRQSNQTYRPKLQHLIIIIHISSVRTVVSRSARLIWADILPLEFFGMNFFTFSLYLLMRKKSFAAKCFVWTWSNAVSFEKDWKMVEVKPGHFAIKEYHFHVYWFVNNEEQGKNKTFVMINFKFMLV